MTKQTQGAALTGALSLIFVALEWLFGISTGLAGVFVMGVAGGLLLGQQMTRSTPSVPLP